MLVPLTSETWDMSAEVQTKRISLLRRATTMTMTKEKFEEIKIKYPLLLVTEDDAAQAFKFVQEVLEAEAEAIKIAEPYATSAISRLETAAREVYDIGADAEAKAFSKG